MEFEDGFPTDGSPKSDFEISYVSESVVLELFGGRFYVVDCLCDEFVFEGFPAAVLHFVVSPLAMLFDVSFILYGFSASV